MTHTESEDAETPRKSLTWERIEGASPCKSTDSPAELAELWRDRRPAIVALYRNAGIDPHPETIVTDIVQIIAKTFNNRLPLGALLGLKWGQLEKAHALWLSHAESRVWQHLPYVVASLGGPLKDAKDEAIRNAWDKVTGYAVPCPPIEVIRRVTS